jgi:hypothetical protein
MGASIILLAIATWFGFIILLKEKEISRLLNDNIKLIKETNKLRDKLIDKNNIIIKKNEELIEFMKNN